MKTNFVYLLIIQAPSKRPFLSLSVSLHCKSVCFPFIPGSRRLAIKLVIPFVFLSVENQEFHHKSTDIFFQPWDGYR